MDKKKKSMLIRLLVCVGILAVTIPVGFITKAFSSASFANVSFNLKNLLKLLIMAAVVIAIQTGITLILKQLKPKSHRAQSIISIVISLLKYVAIIVIICWGLSIIGVNVSTIVASVGIVALIVGFSAESLISDVVTGAFMIFENQYNVGDIVEVDNFRGTVTNIGIRTTSITDVGDNVKIVNNSDMKNILNRSDNLSRSFCDIAIPYATDLEALEAKIPALMEKIGEERPDVYKSAPHYLGVQSLADSAVVLRFMVNVDEKDIYSGARMLNHDIFLGLRSLGVECPFPQLDIHQIH